MVSASSNAQVAAAVRAIAAGEIVLVLDGEDRENEGDLVVAAECATPEAINFMVTHGRGLVCVPMAAERLEELRLPPMKRVGGDRFGTAFAVSVDVRAGTTTGVSAADRAATARALADPASVAGDFARPGHIFPLASRPRGVLARAGHTEAATDLAALAGRHSAGVICEVLSEDGSMARRPELMRFARRHRLPMLTIAELIAFRDRSEPRVRRRCERLVTTSRGNARAAVFDDLRHAGEHVALVVGDAPSPGNPVPVHVRRTCTLGDALHVACSCRRRLERALDELSTRGHGLIVHLAGDGTSCDAGTPLDGRLTAAILDDLGVTAVDLVGATPGLSRTLSEHGIEVARRADRRLRAIELPATSVA